LDSGPFSAVHDDGIAMNGIYGNYIENIPNDVYLFSVPPSTWAVFFNLQDGAPVPNTNLWATITPFAFNTASPLVAIPVVNGESVLDTKIVITTVFDDPAAVLALGTIASPSVFIPAANNDPQTVGGYGSEENVNFTGAEAVRLTLTPGTSTQGAGYLVVVIKRP